MTIHFTKLYKRLEDGTFRWPRNANEAMQITAQQYEWLCMGFEVEVRNKLVKTAGLRFS
ncbi:MAG: IS66 family insertion sequence element accessory protein TnpB [Oscillospiraceae bacterium]|nr:IS66 family insertion sequence element accessory protein TnpB [Oscillospiraceae bacterium]